MIDIMNAISRKKVSNYDRVTADKLMLALDDLDLSAVKKLFDTYCTLSKDNPKDKLIGRSRDHVRRFLQMKINEL